MSGLANARIVLADAVIAGSVAIGDDGRIGAVEAGGGNADGRKAGGGALDLDGDYLIPGIVDLHTDNLERQVLPRATARWPSRSALVAHDAQCAVAGVTTVLDALCVGDIGHEQGRVQTFRDALRDLDALAHTGLMKAEHFLHLRCELPADDMLDLLEAALDHEFVRLVSLMDHSPGVGQFADLGRYKEMRRRDGLTEAEVEAAVAELQTRRAQFTERNRQGLLARVRGRGVRLASHDDRSAEDIQASVADGIGIAEFPVSMAAAREAHAQGMTVIAGAPNIVRGGSHTGNVAALDLVAAGLVDALASDYVPGALIEAAFRIAAAGVLDLPAAIGLISAAPAAMVGFADRGRIAPGLRADLVRVAMHDGMPIVRQVWRGGARVV